MLFLALEFGLSFIPFARDLRPLLMLVPALMATIVAFAFVQVRRGPTIVRGFAVAGLFWLLVLLGLGSMDPLTRTDYVVQNYNVR